MVNKIYDSLKEVYDPEIPLDIVNLGLVKAIDIKDNCINITSGEKFRKAGKNLLTKSP
jgi:metal-sulfur cluster biosynthetic enzyme